MFGHNPIRKPVKGDGRRLEVKHIFPTIQGEGPLAGVPAVFVRLSGCNLQCNFCDTEFDDGFEMDVKDIVRQVEEFSLANDNGTRVRRLAVITGGEPLRQPIGALCQVLLDAGFAVQIETNGTLFRDDLPEAVTIVCSPKTANGRYLPVRADMLARASALKFLISAGRDEYRTVGDVGQGEHDIPVYVQPMDEYDAEMNAANLALARQLVQTHGYHLSLQLHKIIGVE